MTKKQTELTCKLNKSFSKLSKKDKRIALAKDVLIQLEAGIIFPISGTYFKVASYGNHSRIKLDYNKEFREILPNVKCNVCAKGALFVSHIMRTNEFTVKQTIQFTGNNTDMVGRLKNIFTTDQLNLIETAYEGFVVSDETTTLSVPKGFDRINTPIANKAIKFYERYDNESNRLIHIMENIIKNDGTFKP